MSHSNKTEFTTRWSWSDPILLYLAVKISKVFYYKLPSLIAGQLSPPGQHYNESPAREVAGTCVPTQSCRGVSVQSKVSLSL